MFGGAGLFRRGLMYGLATSDGQISLKVDDGNREDFVREGCEEWNYARKDGKAMKMGYWHIPERLTEDPDELLEWSEKAFEAAMRIDQSKPPSQRKLT
jgi:DNA transformation protein